ncbi:MAG: hypothetical protein PHU71_07095 [Candidatus Gracilibacteria bacterium]|nr:hypothetical protein [Candidatus Gracilibacteria bacterium]
MTDITDSYEISISSNAKFSAVGLEKIEPLTNYPIGYIESGVECITGIESPNNFELKNKLNEVIDKVNLIMDYLNQGVGKGTQLTT